MSVSDYSLDQFGSPHQEVLYSFFGEALSEVTITHCGITARRPNFDITPTADGLGVVSQVIESREVVIEGAVPGSITPALNSVFVRHFAKIRFESGVPSGIHTRFEIRRIIPVDVESAVVSLPLSQPTLDAAQADPTFQELPESEREAAGRFLGRVDAPVPAQMKTGQSLDTLAVNFNMARTNGETDAQLRHRIRTTMATNKRIIA